MKIIALGSNIPFKNILPVKILEKTYTTLKNYNINIVNFKPMFLKNHTPCLSCKISKMIVIIIREIKPKISKFFLNLFFIILIIKIFKDLNY